MGDAAWTRHGDARVDPTDASVTEGVSVSSCGDDIIMYGGWQRDRVWKLHVPTASWLEICTCGAVPPARFYHAAAFFNGFMLMCGGQPLQAPCTPDLEYYELATDTYEWTAIECFGDLPAARSHHSATVLGDSLIVCGGKPADGRPVTAAAISEAKRVGFYDVYLLHIVSRFWRRVNVFDPHAPMLWGHSAVAFRGAFVLFFGGFDVSASEFRGTPFVPLDEAPPSAVLCDLLHIFSLEQLRWSRLTPQPSEAFPVSRALHFASSHRTRMFVCGGLAVDHAGRAVELNDFWEWNIETGVWRKLEFALAKWSGTRPIAAMFHHYLVAVDTLASLLYLDVSKHSRGWIRIATSVVPRIFFADATHIAENDPHSHAANVQVFTGSGNPSAGNPPVRVEALQIHAEASNPYHAEELSEPQRDRTVSPAIVAYGVEVEGLRDEVARLRAQVSDLEIAAAASSPPKNTVTISLAPEPPTLRLHKWTVEPPSDPVVVPQVTTKRVHARPPWVPHSVDGVDGVHAPRLQVSQPDPSPIEASPSRTVGFTKFASVPKTSETARNPAPIEVSPSRTTGFTKLASVLQTSETAQSEFFSEQQRRPTGNVDEQQRRPTGSVDEQQRRPTGNVDEQQRRPTGSVDEKQRRLQLVRDRIAELRTMAKTPAREELVSVLLAEVSAMQRRLTPPAEPELSGAELPKNDDDVLYPMRRTANLLPTSAATPRGEQVWQRTAAETRVSPAATREALV